MKQVTTFNSAGSSPAQAKPKGRLKYKPMPQTVRELAASTLYRVQFRNSAFIAHPRRDPEQDWVICTVPKEPDSYRVMYAVNLPKDTAEQVIQYLAEPALRGHIRVPAGQGMNQHPFKEWLEVTLMLVRAYIPGLVAGLIILAWYRWFAG